MLLQAASPIPHLTSQNYPVDVLLRIYSEGKSYGLEIQSLSAGQVLRTPIEMFESDLAALNKQLQEQIRQIARQYQKSDLNSKQSEELLHSLAELGKLAFRRVFSNRNSMGTIQALSELDARSIQIVSREFFLPWELIYPASLEELSYEHFWGMKYLISRVIIVQDFCSGVYVSPTIRVTNPPKLGLLTDGHLAAVSQKEMPFFEELDGKGKIILFT